MVGFLIDRFVCYCFSLLFTPEMSPAAQGRVQSTPENDERHVWIGHDSLVQELELPTEIDHPSTSYGL